MTRPAQLLAQLLLHLLERLLAALARIVDRHRVEPAWDGNGDRET